MSRRGEPWSLETFTGAFLRMEREFDAGRLMIGGCRVWDHIRMQVFNAAAVGVGLYSAPHRNRIDGARQIVEKLPQYILGALRAFRRNRNSPATVVLANPRRKLDVDTGLWVDPYTDPFIDTLGEAVRLWEPRYGGTHQRPTPRRNIAYLDLIELCIGLCKRLGAFLLFPKSSETARLKNVEQAMLETFEIRIDVLERARKAALGRLFGIPVYKYLLCRNGIKKLFLTCSYDKEIVVEACRRSGVLCIELQHGTISPYHLGYHYPEGIEKKTVPDEFWSFGEYWHGKAEFPKSIKLVAFGYPFLENQVSRYSGTQKSRMILFISQGSIGDRLSRIAAEAAGHIPVDIRIVYKLHPTEVLGWKERYPWLAAAQQIEVMAGQAPELYELLAEAEWVAGVYSTAIYEGFRFGCKTVLFDLPGVEYMKDVLEAGDAILASSVSTINESLDFARNPNFSSYFL